MTTLVVLAAGRGSRLGRLGDELPKCLLSLNGRAILSHQFELAPPNARLVVVTGYRADQVEEYVRLAHPELDVTFVREVNWGRGPGASLLEARAVVGDDDLVFVACDTLWDDDPELWAENGTSWVAVAPIPAGTPGARWCRVVPDTSGQYAVAIHDKTPTVSPRSLCWIALARVAIEDLERFWEGLIDAPSRAGEVQLSGGLDAIVNGGEPLWVHNINWLDVGDEQAYRSALAATTGYDALKPDQVTYVLPEQRRVVKWHVDPQKIAWRVERAKLLGDVVPTPVPVSPIDDYGSMMAYEYVPGVSLYDVTTFNAHHRLLNWWDEHFWSTRVQFADRPPNWADVTMKFYRDKTFARVMALEPTLRSIALDAVTRVDWGALIEGCVPGIFHGDLTYANIIVRDDARDLTFIGIDWREDFAGETTWGDLRYDLGKLLGGTEFHWGRGSYGDFRRWPAGQVHRVMIENKISDMFRVDLDDVRRIAALTLISSAPLHAAPMDEILIARGTRWLAEVT